MGALEESNARDVPVVEGAGRPGAECPQDWGHGSLKGYATLKAGSAFMNPSTRNTEQAESPKPSTVESEDLETRANRLAADQMAAEVVEGFRKLAQQKASRKAPNQAA